MPITKYLRAFALFIATLALVGCANVPMGSPAEDARAKQFTPAPETASLYIYRNENFGGAIPMAVSVNNQNIGQSGPMSYFHLSVAPGVYNIESVAENTSSVSVNVEASKNYFVWQEVKMGVWMARTQLNRTDETAGRKGVMESKILAAKLPGSRIQPIGAGSAAAQPAAVVITAVAPAPAMTDATANANASAPADAKIDRLRQLQKLYEDKLISATEYGKKRQEILRDL